MPAALATALRVGTDIVHVPRVERLVSRHGGAHLRPWAGKVFGRREWPALEAKIAAWEGERAEGRGVAREADHGSGHERDRKVQLRGLATWLAGRWAAKEAAIKAHSQRSLHLRQITILSATRDLHLVDGACSIKSIVKRAAKPRMFIHPPTPTVVMSAEVAAARGIGALLAAERRRRRRRQDRRDEGQGSGARAFLADEQFEDEANDSDRPLRNRSGPVRRALRMSPADDADNTDDACRSADVSISHDGEYATAVCLALDEALSAEQREVEDGLAAEIVDDGRGPPIHEPIYGDEGFYNVEGG